MYTYGMGTVAPLFPLDPNTPVIPVESSITNEMLMFGAMAAVALFAPGKWKLAALAVPVTPFVMFAFNQKFRRLPVG